MGVTEVRVVVVNDVPVTANMLEKFVVGVRE